jgi:3-mercaptopyruvate sulfurtransferase SseA
MNNLENNRSGRNFLPFILVVIGLLLLGGVLLWTSLRSRQVKASSEASQAVSSGDSLTPAPEIKRVSAEEAKTAFDSQSATFVDVRSNEAYKESHIPGALNIPLAQIENRAGELDPNQWIITYCT